MRTVRRLYNEICMSKYTLLGFTKHRLTYARIIGDVIQTFTLKSLAAPNSYTVVFDITPLCVPGPIYLDAGEYELDKFFIDKPFEKSYWTYRSESTESARDCIESISSAIDLRLIPLFDNCIDCKTTLSELIKLEEYFDLNRRELLHQLGESDCAVPWKERSLFDYKKYYMALKSHNFAYAQHYLSNQIDFYRNKLDEFNRAHAPRQPSIVRERYIEKQRIYSEHLELLLDGNLAYFDSLLLDNEIQMHNYLKTQYPKLEASFLR